MSDLRILVGTNDLKSGGKYYDVEKFVAHEKYDNPQYAYDIAVIKVKGLIEFNEKVQPIKLSQKEVPDGVELQLTGWGDTSVSFISFSIHKKFVQIENKLFAGCRCVLSRQTDDYSFDCRLY